MRDLFARLFYGHGSIRALLSDLAALLGLCVILAALLFLSLLF